MFLKALKGYETLFRPEHSKCQRVRDKLRNLEEVGCADGSPLQEDSEQDSLSDSDADEEEDQVSDLDSSLACYASDNLSTPRSRSSDILPSANQGM